MELTLNVEVESLSQRELKLKLWKQKQLPDLPHEDDRNSYRGDKMMMNKIVYDWARQDKFDELFDSLSSKEETQLLSTIGEQVGPSGNTLLHGAAAGGSRGVTELLVHHFPALISRKNFHGDTALHSAARAGKLDTAKTLINYFTERGGLVLKMRNDKGNTALHEAIINDRDDVAEFLALADPEMSYYKNNEDKSPLYLAAESDDKKLLSFLLDAIMAPSDASPILPEGKSVVHAALDLKRIDSLKQIAGKKPELLRVKDKMGDNPLHFASSKGYVDGVRFLLQKCRDCAIESNKEGNLPIHVACQNGQVGVVSELLDEWSDPTEFLNDKRQNILHVAAENGKEKLVSYILKLDDNIVRALVNEKDEEGNTPLHLAAKNDYPTVVFALVTDPRVEKEVKNSENLTAFYIALYYAPMERESKLNLDKPDQDRIANDQEVGTREAKAEHATDKRKQYSTKKGEVAPPRMGTTVSILYFYANVSERATVYDWNDHSEPNPPSREEIRSKINTLLVVAVLVAGVTFSGGIQLPENKSAFLLWYIGCDMLALNASLLSATILLSAQFCEAREIAMMAIWWATFFISLSIYMMLMTFMFTVSIAVRQFVLFHMLLLSVQIISLLILTAYSFALLAPKLRQIARRPFVIFAYLTAFFISLKLRRIGERFFSHGPR